MVLPCSRHPLHHARVLRPRLKQAGGSFCIYSAGYLSFPQITPSRGADLGNNCRDMLGGSLDNVRRFRRTVNQAATVRLKIVFLRLCCRFPLCFGNRTTDLLYDF